jgi:chromosome partitioning protein
MRTIAVANQKGGCGKTTTAVNIAAALALSGKKVLIVDFDPQGHASMGLGANPDALEKTIYDCFTSAQISVENVLISTGINGLALAPSNVLLSGLEFELAVKYGREFALKEHLSKTNGSFDICIIDCSPSLSLMTLNALVASDEVIIPVQVQYYAIEGLKQLLGTVDIVKQRFNKNLKILGILLTFVEGNTNLSSQIQSQMREFFGDLVFNTVIHKTVRFAEAPSAGLPILTYAPRCRGAEEYLNLADEIIYRKSLARENKKCHRLKQVCIKKSLRFSTASP